MNALVEAYLLEKDDSLKEIYLELFKVVEKFIDPQTELVMQYGMPSYVVPLTRHPKGYRGDTQQPLPYIAIALQKKYVSIYNMSLVEDSIGINVWFKDYLRQSGMKINRGKACFRFKEINLQTIDFIEHIVLWVNVDRWVDFVESMEKSKK